MASVEDHNEREIAEIKRRLRRATTIFIVSLIAMPVGFVGPCLVGAILRQFIPNLSPYVPLSGLLLPLVGLFGVLLMTASRRQYKNALAMATFADERGLRYTYEPPRGSVDFLDVRRFVTMPNMNETGVAAHLVQGVYKKRSLAATEYGYNYVFANRVKQANQTVVVFFDGFQKMPAFAVFPYGWGEAFLQAVGATALPERFKVPGEKEFNRRFAVAGEERDRILDLLTADVIDCFLADDRLTAEVSDSVLVVFRRDTVVWADGYEDLLLQASRLARALEAARR